MRPESYRETDVDSSSSLQCSPDSSSSNEVAAVSAISFYGKKATVPKKIYPVVLKDCYGITSTSKSFKNKQTHRRTTTTRTSKKITPNVIKVEDENEVSSELDDDQELDADQEETYPKRRAAKQASEKIKKLADEIKMSTKRSQQLDLKLKDLRRKAAKEVDEKIKQLKERMNSDDSEFSDDESEERYNDYESDEYTSKPSKASTKRATVPIPKAEFSEYELAIKKNVDIRMKFLESLKLTDID